MNGSGANGGAAVHTRHLYTGLSAQAEEVPVGQVTALVPAVELAARHFMPTSVSLTRSCPRSFWFFFE